MGIREEGRPCKEENSTDKAVKWHVGEGGTAMVESSYQRIQFSRSVVSDSLRPLGLQHTRLPCPSPTPRPCSNSCPLSRGCHSTISSSVVPFSTCLQSFPASESFTVSLLLTLGGRSIGVSPSPSVLPMNISY